ncbi:uncharacterized protein METZ01_LOCUS464305, partial [marine metagenome]
MTLVAVAVWLWYRSSIGIAYDWRWAQAFEAITTSDREGGTPYFFTGVLATLRLSLWSALIATILGLLVGVGRRSKISCVRLLCSFYILVIRNIPPLVFVFIFYFFISNQAIPLLGLEGVLRGNLDKTNAWLQILFGPARLWENLLSGVLCVS